MNLAGVGAGMGNAIPGAEKAWQDIIAGRQRLQAAARQQQANEAFFKSLVTPDAGAIPQQGPPPPPQQGQAMPPQGGGAPAPMPAGGGAPPPPGMPAPSPGPAAGASPVPPSGSAPVPAGGSSPPPGATAGGPQFDPTQRLRAMAQALKRANPGLDSQTLSMALDKQIETMRGLAPEDRVIMQLELAQQKFQNTRDIAMLRDDLGRLQEAGRNSRADAAQAGAGARNAATNATRENVAGQTNDTRLTIAGNAEAGRNSRAAARIDASKADAGIKAQYKQIMVQRAEIKDKISAFNGGTPGAPKKEEVAALQKQLEALNAKASELWSRNPNLPRPSEIDRLPGDKPGAAPSPAPGAAPAGGTASKDNPATPKSDAEFAALPKGAFYTDPDDGKLYQKP